MKPKILLIVFISLFFALIARLYYWQVIKAGELSKSAQGQYNTGKITQGARGNILAPDGTFWAIRSDAWKIYSNTSKMDLSAYSLVRKLAPILNEEEAELEKILNQDKSRILIKSKVTSEIKKNIEALDVNGIEFEKLDSRFYPEASVAAQLLGFVGKDEAGDNIGYFGLEGFYNLPLSGKVGFESGKKDAKGGRIFTESSKQISATNGVDIVTTVDKRIQIIAERNLKEGIEKYGAIGGSITIMDPADGKILAMSSFPSFDPAEYEKYNNQLFRNPIISDSFEPGSIFKVLIMAIGLDEGVISPETECDICEGPLKIDKYEIKTWNNKYQKNIKMTDVIVHSDNVGMAFIGRKLGADKLYDRLSQFGIGEKTGIDLQGEVAPNMRPKGSWNIVDLATATFGQGIAVTGIQMVRSVAAIANGGYLVTPHVVESVKGDGWEEKNSLEKPEKILSESATRKVSLMMREAVNQGESKWAKPKGFDNIAGKTGTAQIAVAGHYDAEATNHSFIGFAPYDKPKFVMLVTLKSPQASPWAAETAAPLWFSISGELFTYLGISP